MLQPTNLKPYLAAGIDGEVTVAMSNANVDTNHGRPRQVFTHPKLSNLLSYAPSKAALIFEGAKNMSR